MAANTGIDIRARLLNVLALLRTRLWIVPALMSVGGLALAYALLGPLRPWADFGSSQLWWLYSGDASSARTLLGALLSGAITMTSLVVSLTFVTLSLAASQLGPRLIVNFIADREIQAVLGLFLATILYLIVVMRTLGNELGPESVPHLTITLASLLTIACLFALLFYVHKISRAIIADNVIDQVFHDLRSRIESMEFLAPDEQETREHAAPPARCSVSLEHVGYVQTIDYDALVSWAEKNQAVLRVHVKAGDFVLAGGRHIEIHTFGEMPEKGPDELRKAIVVGTERSPAQDLDYSIRQLVELAVRALSPGVNDPFTAIAAVDKLGATMELIFSRPALRAEFRDESEKLRVIAIRSTRESLADLCFDQIRQAGARDTAVLVHLAETLGKLAASRHCEDAHEILSKHLDRIHRIALDQERSGSEQALLLERLDVARLPIDRAARARKEGGSFQAR